MINANQILKPVTEENPCGENLYYDPSFQELESLMKGKEETQFSPAEPPDFQKLQTRCLELLERSKDLRLLTNLCAATVKVEGLLSLREVFAALRELLTKHWEGLYPRLDPDDNNDPTERMNIMASLANPRGTFGDSMKFLERLHEAPLTNSTQLGRFSLADIARAEAGAGAGPDEEKRSVTAEQIQAAFRDTSEKDLSATHQAVTDCIEIVNAIDEFLTSQLGSGSAPNLEVLVGGLEAIRKSLAPYMAGGEPAGEEAQDPSGTAGGGASSVKGISGEIQSRQDVSRMLDKLCDYYKRTEPASPVPHLLRRAQRLSAMDFMAIIRDICPDAESAVKTVTGTIKTEGGES